MLNGIKLNIVEYFKDLWYVPLNGNRFWKLGYCANCANIARNHFAAFRHCLKCVCAKNNKGNHQLFTKQLYFTYSTNRNINRQNSAENNFKFIMHRESGNISSLWIKIVTRTKKLSLSFYSGILIYP